MNDVHMEATISLIDSPFSMGELLSTPGAFKVPSTLGPDDITYAALYNLPEQHKIPLLRWINQVCGTAELTVE